VAASLNNLAMLYQLQGAYAEAEPLYVRALRICEKALGAEHPELAASLNNLAELHRARGAYAEAEPLHERALRICEKALGAEHPDVATSLNNLAMLYQLQGAYAEAEPLYVRALRICEALGAEHPDVARSLSNLASLYQAQGAYVEAGRLFERALHICEKSLGPEHVYVARSLNNLAGLYRAAGSYARAEPLYERALRIHERSLGAEHPDVAVSLTNLAGLYAALGAYAQAEPLFDRALRIAETTLGAEHPDLVTSLNNLAMLHQDQGAYAEAEPLFERALRISEKALGAEHRDVATLLNNLAVLHQVRGAHAKAEPLLERALRISEKALGAEHRDVATLLSNLAELCLGQNAHAKAERLFERALRIYEKSLGAEHPDVATVLGSLAGLCWEAGDVSAALRHYTRATALCERHVGLTVAALAERRKRQFLRTALAKAEVLVSFHAHGAPDDVDALALTLTTTLRRKGRVLAELASEHAAMRRDLSPALQAELDVLRARQGELARRRQAAYDPRDTDALHALVLEVEQREGELNRKSASFRAYTAPLRIESVQAALPPNATLVEFVRYRRLDPNDDNQRWKEARYIAYLLPCEGPPQWLALGDAAPIDAAVTAALTALAHPRHDARDVLRALDELVFAPIRRRLGPTHHFVLSPDAALHLVPFAALIDEDGNHLVERMLISYVTSGRDLVRSAAQDPARSKPLVIAAPSYEGRCAALPGAEAEAGALRKHFADVDLYVGSLATKDKLTAAQGPLFVHVATHGFFGTSRVLAPCQAARSWRDERDITAMSSVLAPPDERRDVEDALDEAGLIFAGPSDAEATLTAREIASIDLRGTQLIVLSACDTGIGEVDRSEGIYGLRRALTIAGAQTQVVSLWKIDDAATSQLMDGYYGELRTGRGRSEALRHAQLSLLHDGRHAHPFYWAAFVALGDDSPLRESV
jgi:CHAT domain-containing protein/tetratricopeptide (TPR) repeat protein